MYAFTSFTTAYIDIFVIHWTFLKRLFSCFQVNYHIRLDGGFHSHLPPWLQKYGGSWLNRSHGTAFDEWQWCHWACQLGNRSWFLQEIRSWFAAPCQHSHLH